MDLLKQEILKKRQRLAEETGGKRVFKRSEIEQKQIQKLREQEKRELEAKAQRQATASNTTTTDGSSAANSNPNASTTTASATTSSNATTSIPSHYLQILIHDHYIKLGKAIPNNAVWCKFRT
ncbi:hypothetical protein GBA52_028119 [Prunus armeniaca]|nr:hypothetical protein GBA52_028119 [Prunus armeniaca]